MSDNGDIKGAREESVPTPKRRKVMVLDGVGKVSREYTIGKACGRFGVVKDMSLEVMKDLGGVPTIKVDFDDSKHPDEGYMVNVLFTGVELVFQYRIEDVPPEPKIVPGTEDELARAHIVAEAARKAKGKVK